MAGYITQAPQLYDWAGKAISSSSAPITNRPGTALTSPQGGMVALGSDYASAPNAQVPKVDAYGNIYTVPVNSAGTAVQVQNQATASSATAVYGQVAVGMYGLQYTALTVDSGQALYVRHAHHATFTVMATNVGLATGKSLLAIVNAASATMVLRLEAVFAENVSSSTGGLLSGQGFNNVTFELRPITSATTTSATQLPIVSHDANDILAAGVTAWTNATVSGDTVGPLRRWTASNYGITPGTTTSEANGSFIQDSIPNYMRPSLNTKAATIRPGYGIHLKCVGPATVGTFDVSFIFTQATA